MSYHLHLHLRKLRNDAGKTVAGLSEESGASVAVLYKAEEGRNVAWKTIEQAYGPLCADQDEFDELLAKWAIMQTERSGRDHSAILRSKIVKIREDETTDSVRQAETGSEMIDILQTLTPPQRKLLTDFARRFRDEKATRKMTEAWMEATAD